MQLYLIVDPSVCDPVATAKAAAEAGVDFIQLRDLKAKDVDYIQTARAVMDAIAGTPAKFIVSERPHLVNRIGAAGVHIGEKYRDVMTAREELGEGPILGVSGFTPWYIAENLGEDFPVDYLSVGPVWTTVSKADAGKAIGLNEAMNRVHISPYHSAIIGGITTENAATVAAAVRRLPARQQAGAMLVVLGEVCRASDPAAVVRALRAAIN
ncbi:MAG: thiamine-phosphate pyrophosphorylase 1 [Actinomycetota bacterium]